MKHDGTFAKRPVIPTVHSKQFHNINSKWFKQKRSPNILEQSKFLPTIKIIYPNINAIII